MEKNNAAEEAFKAATANCQTFHGLEKVVQSMEADTKDREESKFFAEYAAKEIAEAEKAEADSKSADKATLWVLGAAALAVAVPYLINKFKKED